MCYSKYSIAQLNKGLFDYLKSLARISLLKDLICANPEGSAFCRKKKPPRPHWLESRLRAGNSDAYWLLLLSDNLTQGWLSCSDC